MINSTPSAWTLGALMLIAALMSKFIAQGMQDARSIDRPDLEKIIPHTFSDWKIDSISQLRLINSDTQGVENRIYDQTLVRTYINHAGERIMLSIAYGGNQSTDLHVHRPEICYTANGFSISDFKKTLIETTAGDIPAMHLVARQGLRNEPITYWIRIGDSLTRGWLEQKIAAIGYGLTGKIPDGLLVRVSNISRNETASFFIQQKFISEMLMAMRRQDRYWLVGPMTDENTNSVTPPLNIK